MNTGRLLKGLVPPLVFLALLPILARVAAPSWQEVRAAFAAIHPEPVWVGCAVVLAAAHYGLAFLVWKRSLHLAGVSGSAGAAADTWVPGLLSRYIPGKIWSNGIRLAVARRLGAPLLPMTGAMGWEALLSIATACTLGLLTFRNWPDPAWHASVMLVLLATIVALAGARAIVAGGHVPPWLAGLGLRPPAAGGGLLQLATLNLLAWAVSGASAWALACAILPLSLAEAPMIAGAVALAWVGGYLAIVMPAGLVVREGVLVLLLGPTLGTGPVVVVAAGSRLISIGLDLAITAHWMWRRTTVSGVASPPSV